MTENKTNHIQFASLFKPAYVICQTEKTDRNTIIHDLLEKLAYEAGIGNVEEAYKEILSRENESPTIVGPGISMPHARLDAVNKIVIGIVTSKNGIVYAPGRSDNLVKLIILTLAPKAAPGLYLQAISSIAKICQNPETAEKVAVLDLPEDVWGFFNTNGAALPDFLHACDIMEPVTVKLQEHDTLERAIDLFVRHRVNEVPVIDKDGELIGVVTTHELLKVCLPDYVLWMDDLTPVINFEPFAQILRKESKTWLAEIMTPEYATVDENAPAVQVAKEITRQNTDLAYVMRGKKLVGVVSLATFLSKVLRE
ncbi:MAG: PTS sugar transporter subunit IIA [Phycisphaerae bacterium]|jgi:mannitol/fructose-specific phosphotransferase system IIA component (Ntr-type)/predicted transcriptional regulator